MSKTNKILSLMLCFIFIIGSLAYADTVVIGAAPNSSEKTMTQTGNNTFLQNQYTGPGTIPSSSNYLGTSPIQTGVSVDYSSNTTAAANIDENGVGKNGPTANKISSPAANNAAIAQTKGTANVITNNAAEFGTPADNTLDQGPRVQEISSPGANGPNYKGESNSSNNNIYTAGPDASKISTEETTVVESVPSYTTENVGTTNTDMIVYHTVDNIKATLPNISAQAAIIVNASTREIYFSKGGFDALPPAALANLVTSYILLSYKTLETPLTVTATAISNLESGANTAGLKAGDTILVKDAIAAMFVKSCCDVANVAAENVAGSIPAFVNIMNQTVKNWGCVGTNFTNPSGLNNDAQVTNVYDMAVIMDKVTQNSHLVNLLGLTSYTLPASLGRGASKITTKNALITPGTSSYYSGIGTSRMGYTSKAKYTMASTINYNNNQKLIAVVLKANGTQYTDTTKLLNFGKVACVEVGTQPSVANASNNAASNGLGIISYGTNGLADTTADTVGTWKQNNNGWYFEKADGTYAKNEWIKQNGKLYCIDSNGYMITGWREFSNGRLYYFDPSNGEFRYNTWINVSTGAYYLQADGSLATAEKGTTKNIVTTVGIYTIDENGKAIAKVS